MAWTDQQNAGYDRFFDQIIPGLRSINTSTDHFHDTVQLTVGFRLPPRLTPDQVLSALAGLDGADASLRGYSMEHAYLGDKRNMLVRALLAAIRAQGSQPGFMLKGGTSDMNVVGMAWTCPIVAYGPGDSALDHTPDEHLPLDDYTRAVATLRHVIENLTVRGG